MRIKTLFMAALTGAVMLTWPAQSAEPQKGQAFYTDVHGAGAFINSMEAMTGEDWGADERQTNYRQKYAAEENKNYMENTNCRQNGSNCIK